MNLHSHSEPRGPAENEDFVIARRHPGGFDCYICLLADGQGGRAHGAIAAKTACETAWNLAVQRPVETLFDASVWVEILQKADRQTTATGGFTTLIGLALGRHGGGARPPGALSGFPHHPNAPGGRVPPSSTSLRGCSIAGASAGDSKVYFKRASDLTMADWTDRQRKNPPVGSGSADFTPFSHRAVEGGRLLIVSDGAWKYCSYEALKNSFDRSVDTVAQQIRATITAEGSNALPDDLSIIAVDIA